MFHYTVYFQTSSLYFLFYFLGLFSSIDLRTIFHVHLLLWFSSPAPVLYWHMSTLLLMWRYAFLLLLLLLFSNLFLIHQLHVPHQFNLLYFCIFCAKCNHFVWWYVTAKLFEWIYLLWCDSFYNNFSPLLFHSHFHCCSFSSFIISCCIFPECYSNGFFLTHEVNSDYVLLNKLFCFIVINMWEECRFYLHVTF